MGKRRIQLSGSVASVVVMLLLSFSSVQAQTNVDTLVLDTDGDGLTDYEERAIYQTYWYDTDTDDDGYSDNEEVEHGYSPLHAGKTMREADTDGDGLNDEWEIKLGSNLMLPDTDGDGYLDGAEVMAGYSPTSTGPLVLDKAIVVNDKDLTLKLFVAGVELMSVPVSTGKKTTPTPKGEFAVLRKLPVHTYGGPGFDFYYPHTKWNLHFTTKKYRYYIHGAYWHNYFGKYPVSRGCVNVRYEDMELLYDFAQVGTKVVIT